MSRRRRPPRKPLSTIAPADGTPLGHLSEADLIAELGRRRMKEGSSLEDFETAAEGTAEALGEAVLAQSVAALPPEDGTPKACPRCGKPVPVKARNRTRHLLTLAGELRLSRNYHYCRACKHGFYPRDLELKLPEEGEVSEAMERRIVDFGVNASFEAAVAQLPPEWRQQPPRLVEPVEAKLEALHGLVDPVPFPRVESNGGRRSRVASAAAALPVDRPGARTLRGRAGKRRSSQ